MVIKLAGANIVANVVANIVANVVANIVANIVLKMFWEGVLVVIKLAGANWRETRQQFYPRQQNSLPLFVAKYQHHVRLDEKYINTERESES